MSQDQARNQPLPEACPDLNQTEAPLDQDFGPDPIAVRQTDHYRQEYVLRLAERWDQIIDWEGRAAGEGDFFIANLRRRGVRRVLDVATGTGFHSCRLLAAGFEVTSADGSPAMLRKAQENARARGLTLNPVLADWRRLSQCVEEGGFDAITNLGNSFTHLFSDAERRQALAEYYKVLKPGGMLVIDQRNYDTMLDQGYLCSHQYYYCGQGVVVEPDHLDEGLARFRYIFPDTTYYLNMCPLRLDYLLGLLQDGGFGPIETFGDFATQYQNQDVEFFVHLAAKPDGRP